MYNICLGLIFSSVVNETFFFSMLSLFRPLSLSLSRSLFTFSPMYSSLSVCLSNLYRFMSLTLQIGGLILFFLRYSAQLRAFIIFLHLMSPFLRRTNKQHDFILYRHIFCLFDCLSYSASHSLILFLWRFCAMTYVLF